MDYSVLQSLCLTAFNFGRIARQRRDTTPVANVIKSLLYSRPFDAPSLRRGVCMRTMHKKHAQDMAARGEHAQPLQSGLVIDQKDPHVVCSPNNFVLLSSGEVGLVEYT